MRIPRLFQVGISALVCATLVAACGGGSISSPTPALSQPTIAVPGGGSSLTLAPSGTTASAALTVSEPGYTGVFTAISSNIAVATVSPSTITASTRVAARRAEAGSATFTVTAVGPGSATITISDSGGKASTLPVTVTASPVPSSSPSPTPPPPGVLSVNPTSVNVYGTGSANAAQILAQETGYSGSFSQTNNCASIATIASSTGTGPSATFTVTGTNAGTCSAVFSDSNSQHVTASITITTSGFTVQIAH